MAVPSPPPGGTPVGQVPPVQRRVLPFQLMPGGGTHGGTGGEELRTALKKIESRGSSYRADSRELPSDARFAFSISYTGYLISDEINDPELAARGVRGSSTQARVG